MSGGHATTPPLAHRHVPSPAAVPLADWAGAPGDEVGAEAVALGRLPAAGLTVPPGAVLPRAWVRAVLATTLPIGDYRIPGPDPRPSGEPPLLAAMAGAWHEAGRGGLVPVVVRPLGVGGVTEPGEWPATRSWSALGTTLGRLITAHGPVPILVGRLVAVVATRTVGPGPARGRGRRGRIGVEARHDTRALRRAARALGAVPTLHLATDADGNQWVLGVDVAGEVAAGSAEVWAKGRQ